MPNSERQRITSSRGLQQGNPLSALAPTIAMEAASDASRQNYVRSTWNDAVITTPQHTAEAVLRINMAVNLARYGHGLTSIYGCNFRAKLAGMLPLSKQSPCLP
eukprot:3215882-Amphidinium_carterae.2